MDDTSNKSCLSLPVEPPPSGLPVEQFRRKLSVQGLMAFAERRRSSSTFSDMRKMSVSNGDGVHIRSPGGVGKYEIDISSHKTYILRSFNSYTWWTTNAISSFIENDQIC